MKMKRGIEMKHINILYQCDNNFAFMTGVSCTSLLINAKKNRGGVFYSIYILNTDISEENKKRFYSLKKQFPDIFF